MTSFEAYETDIGEACSKGHERFAYQEVHVDVHSTVAGQQRNARQIGVCRLVWQARVLAWQVRDIRRQARLVDDSDAEEFGRRMPLKCGKVQLNVRRCATKRVVNPEPDRERPWYGEGLTTSKPMLAHLYHASTDMLRDATRRNAT